MQKDDSLRIEFDLPLAIHVTSCDSELLTSCVLYSVTRQHCGFSNSHALSSAEQADMICTRSHE